MRKHITIISTGGTIEKTYCASDGSLRNAGSVLDLLLQSLHVEGVELERIHLFDKDSLDMVAADHELLASTVEDQIDRTDGVIVVHGTDRLSVSGERIHDRLVAAESMSIPVVLTGAMRPFELRTSDATQNVTEALLAVRLLDAGVYCVMHGQVLAFPGVTKDLERGTFVSSRE